ncbi:uncharacterized protein LOC125195603 [Salvia hispanica]|uniref:uncharacterized protein LOC125195603 n=1 Tax=Salvia hispanica TaxID=49212 RepID=UPI002008F580|nr:uncharacterized protein LOC125195603 [Salvia hispanica]
MCAKHIWICIILSFPLVFSLIVILTTLAYVGVKPRFYIQELYIPSLNTSNSHTHNFSNPNTSIIIDLKFKREIAYVEIRYEKINVTLFYGPNRSSGAIGSTVVAGFFQGRKKKARRRAVVDARGLPWEEAFERVSGGSTVEVAVEVSTGYRLRRCNEDDCYYTGIKAVVVAADLVVDGSGVEVSKKATRLKKVMV